MVLTQLEACCQLINPGPALVPGAWYSQTNYGANFINTPLQSSMLSSVSFPSAAVVCQSQVGSCPEHGGKWARCDEEQRFCRKGVSKGRWMNGYVRKRDRWEATEQVESTIEPSTSPSLYNDTLHWAINKSMSNTCSAALMMEILAWHYFAASAYIDKNQSET